MVASMLREFVAWRCMYLIPIVGLQESFSLGQLVFEMAWRAHERTYLSGLNAGKSYCDSLATAAVVGVTRGPTL